MKWEIRGVLNGNQIRWKVEAADEADARRKAEQKGIQVSVVSAVAGKAGAPSAPPLPADGVVAKPGLVQVSQGALAAIVVGSILLAAAGFLIGLQMRPAAPAPAGGKPPGGRTLTADQGLVVTRASFRSDRAGIDVTDAVRNAAADGLFQRKEVSWPDPDFGRRKTLVIHGTYGGKEFVLTATDNEFMEGLSFGAPPSHEAPGVSPER
jgi:hypothetical protein